MIDRAPFTPSYRTIHQCSESIIWTRDPGFEVKPNLTNHGGPYRGVAEEAEYDHGQRRGEDGAEHDAGQAGVDQGHDQILHRDQHRARPAVQRAP